MPRSSPAAQLALAVARGKRAPRRSTVNPETRRREPADLPAIEVALRLKGPNGSHGDYRAAAAMRKRERSAVRNALYARFGTIPPPLPLVVILTRVAFAEMDEDNFAAGAKSVRDGVADWLGLANDRNPSLLWVYRQERAPRGTFRVRVEIRRAP
jgi:hypothetical protein